VRGARIKAAFRKIPGIKKAAAPLYKLGYKSVEDLQKALRNGNKDFMRVMERFSIGRSSRMWKFGLMYVCRLFNDSPLMNRHPLPS